MTEHNEDEKPREPDSMTSHRPHPYAVRVRVTESEDTVPRVHEYRGIAYSVFEAVMQATFEAGAKEIDGVKCKVEAVGPDLEAYVRMFGVRILAGFGVTCRRIG